VEVGGVKIDVREVGMVQWPAQKGFDLLIKTLGDATHLRFGDAAVATQDLYQCVDFASGVAADIGLHHHGEERLVDSAAGLQPVGEVAALAQLWDGKVDVTHLGIIQPPAVAIGIGGALIEATHVELGAVERGNPCLQQLLKAAAQDLRHQGASDYALHELDKLGGASMGGHGLCSV